MAIRFSPGESFAEVVGNERADLEGVVVVWFWKVVRASKLVALWWKGYTVVVLRWMKGTLTS